MSLRFRRTIGLAIASASALVLVVALLVVGLQVDRYEVVYPSIVQARAEEAVERGWIPDWIPEQASDLHAVHDTNGTAALFSARLPATVTTPATCMAASSIAAPVLEADWFPTDAPGLGPPLQCDDWVGVRADERLLLWRP